MVFVLGFSNQKSTTPNSYYQVYLDGSILGTISSKRELQDYIRNQASVIRENVLDYEKKLNAIKDVNDTISKTSETLIGEDYNAFLSFNNTLRNFIFGHIITQLHVKYKHLWIALLARVITFCYYITS